MGHLRGEAAKSVPGNEQMLTATASTLSARAG
jgi:hypothetical protein